MTLDKFLPRSGEGLAGDSYEAAVWSYTDAVVEGKVAAAPLVLTVVASSYGLSSLPFRLSEVLVLTGYKTDLLSVHTLSSLWSTPLSLS